MERAWILMSNHFHLVVTDVEGKAPFFFQFLDQTIANLLKRHLGAPEDEGEEERHQPARRRAQGETHRDDRAAESVSCRVPVCAREAL